MKAGNEEAVVSLSHVCCTAPSGKRILDDVSLAVRRGECVLLVGRSGSGKTTITKCINGLVPSFEPGIRMEGRVRVCGLDPSACEMYELAKHVGSVFQNPKSQFFNLTSNDELAFGLETQGVAADEIERRVRETVSSLGAKRLIDRDVSTMSGGEKQSLVFASIDASRPDVFVLDEPTANLDASSVRALHDEIASVLKEGKSVVIAEHRLYFAMDLADRAVLVENGRIAREFAPEELASLDRRERELLGLRATDPADALAISIPRAGGGRREKAGGARHKDGARQADGARHKKTGAKRRESSLRREDCPRKAGGEEGLRLSSFTVERDGKAVFDPVSLFVPNGGVVGVLGENGIGKSTLLRGIAGLERRDAGTVEFCGKRLSRKDRRRAASLVMQDVNHQLFSDSVLNECLLAAGGRNDGETVARAKEALAALDLSDLLDVHPMALSGGQKQRLAIACALLARKRLLLLDEPTSGLDFDRMVEVARLVRSLARANIAIMLVTHDHEFLNRCCDEALFLERAAEESPDER